MAERTPVVAVTVGGATYPAGQPLPDGVADLIDNPKVWGDEPTENPVDEEPKPAKKAAAKKAPTKKSSN